MFLARGKGIRASELTGARVMGMRASGEISMEEQICLEKGHGNAFIHLVQVVYDSK